MRFPLKNLKKVALNNALTRGLVSGAFTFVWYHSEETWQKNTFLGYPILQCPLDLQLYQELIHRIRPRYIIQTGVWKGGSLLYFATLLDLIGAPGDQLAVGVDIELTKEARSLRHPRVRLIEGDSKSPETIGRIRQIVPSGGGMVVLDSNHQRSHVLAELRAYREFVGVGSYLVVEDTVINGHPVEPFWGPGPHEAVEEFLPTQGEFVRDDELWKRNMISFHRRGWLRRVR